MNPLFIKSLAYEADSACLFERIANLSGAVFLDSGHAVGRRGRFDILTALPREMIISRNGKTEVCSEHSRKVYQDENPFAIIRQQLVPVQAFEAYPFLTGAIGYFSYDLGRCIEVLPTVAYDKEQLPEMMVGIYDWAVVVDHEAQQTALIALRDAAIKELGFDGLYALLKAERTVSSAQPFSVTGPISSNMKKQEYLDKFSTIMGYIRAGDCYQVNLAQKFSVPVTGDAWEAYKKLRKLNSAPFSAYLSYDDFQVMSISPERFLQLRAGHVTTKPIKGTRPRCDNIKQDLQAMEDLKNSGKDRAENLMIVDLLRNDLSKNCRLNSILVSSLFNVETFANVHHLVSTVEGELYESRDALHLLEGCFPGGSVTGAPKLRAMEIIEELEPNRRGVYCGAIGYISRHGDMDMNIAIRTAVKKNDSLSFYGGGGLVADSNGEQEYQETLDKVSTWFDLISIEQADSDYVKHSLADSK